MVCPKCGNDMGDSLYCCKCNSHSVKGEYPSLGKQTLKVLGITLGIFAVFMIIVIAFINFDERSRENELLDSQYEKAYRYFMDGEYYSALVDIEEFERSEHRDNNTFSQKFSKLDEQIESELYSKILLSTDKSEVVLYCGWYVEFYSTNAHITEVNEKYEETINILAPLQIEEAQECILNGDYLEADRILSGIVDNSIIAQEYVDEAHSIKDSIAEKVAYETPNNISVETLMSNAFNYDGKNVVLTNDVIVISVDREREMLVTSPVSDVTALGYDYSFILEIYYGNMSDKSRWASISSNEDVKLTYVSGRFNIYSNRTNSGYIDAKSIN